MQLPQKMEEKKSDVKMFWTQLGGRRVDVIFEQVQNVLLLLKQKIKNGTATNQECWQAWALVNEANLGDLLTLTNVSDMFDGDGRQETKPEFQRLTDDNTADSAPGSHSKKEEMEKTGSGSKAASSKIQDLPLNLQYQNHKCSSACLANRAGGSYKGENPLKMPILFDFQRRHAKADCLSKSLDVNYKAPCGRSLRSFQDVQNYLFETECNFLFVDHFSFNTYVLLGRNTVNPEPLVFDFDISNGAESVPVSFCNDLDRARLPYFKYRRASWPRGYFLNNFSTMFVDSCDCTDGCIDRSKCACLQLTARGCSKISLSPSSKTSCGYSYKRLEGPVPSGIYECSVLCRCDKMMCQNRVVQHGIQVRLQVFNTEKKGWGVRCLDDIDKGTFVCTYSGRLMSRAEVQVLGDAGQELKEKSAVNDRGHGFFSRKRKLESDCSDSVIELVQTGKNDILEKQESLSQTVDNENKSTLVHPRNLSIATSRRPGTRTVVFRNHHLKMEIDTLVHSASSDEDNSSQIHQSSKTKLTSGTKKGKEKSTQQWKEEHLMEIGQTESADMNSAECKRKGLSLQGVDCGKSGVLDDTCIVKPSKDVPLKADCKEENHRQSKQDAFCEEADGDRTLLKNANEENTYVLDATKEGNVGRFLNHSCCPNLFAQSVFVETHNRSFPWVAFFTNRHVKAGTELTWDYGYEAGSMPETEISCQCGVQKSLCKERGVTDGRFRPLEEPPPKVLAKVVLLNTRISPESVRTPGAVDSTFSLFLKKFPEPPELDPLIGPEQGLCICIDSSFPALGVFQIMAKMVRRTCAFCSEGEAGSVMYIAKERNIAAHQDCLLFSSGFVESEEYNPDNLDIRFDVASVLKELKRGKRLMCNFCRKKGATVGCEERACRRSYHYFCALCDDAAIETDEVNGVYRVFCPKHDPGNRTNHYDAASKRRRHALKSSTITEQMSTEETAEENSLRILKRKNNRHKGVRRVLKTIWYFTAYIWYYNSEINRWTHPSVLEFSCYLEGPAAIACQDYAVTWKFGRRYLFIRIDFLRKCKQAGLLDDIFEEMLDTLHLAQEKLMDDNTSETEYEETVMSLFDCGLFENILTNIHSGTEEKIRELLESRKRLDNKIELLQDLKEVVLPTQENAASTSSTVSE
ncbi:histone-lysine N-methyltransferase SETDB2-like [Buteo buteo]|uniref:histone-lysine N-methyltransferase SETDB2-like n=1 Tax=Buteo buteo TaxID=30397 RepID=UPI003EBBA0EE